MRYRAILVIPLVLCAGVIRAQEEGSTEKSGYEVMLKNYEQMTTRNFRSDVVMTMISYGRTQTRHVKRLSKTDGQDQESYMVKFIGPPSVRGTTLLMVDQSGRDDDVWFYLPAIKKVKRISGSNMRASYMGTEFSYKDIKREKVKLKTSRYVLVKKELLGDTHHSVIDAFPVTKQEKAEQGYHHRRIWIRQDNHLMTRVDFFDEDGEFLKRLVCSDMREVGKSGKTRYFKFTMTNRKGVKTILRFNMMKIDEKDPDDKYFTKGFLMGRK